MPTVAGPVQMAWSRSATSFSLQLTIPANAAANVAIPAANKSAVRERGFTLGAASGVTSGSFANGVAVLAVGSGSYEFTSALT